MEKKLNIYTNGNHKVTIYSDGTKIKETIDPKADHFTYEFPENFDIKITDQCDGGCTYCFPEGTPVRLPNGTKKAIEAITEGDKVLSYDVMANKFVIGVVTRLFKREYKGDLIGIELNGVTTWCTPNHKILTKNRGLVQASDITLTDDILTYSPD